MMPYDDFAETVIHITFILNTDAFSGLLYNKPCLIKTIKIKLINKPTIKTGIL